MHQTILLVYENVCRACNPGAGAKKELGEVWSDIPAIYVSETSRTVFEISKECWGGLEELREAKPHATPPGARA